MKHKQFEVRKNKGHYDVYVNGHFYCSADTLAEASVECKNYTEREVNV